MSVDRKRLFSELCADYNRKRHRPCLRARPRLSREGVLRMSLEERLGFIRYTDFLLFTKDEWFMKLDTPGVTLCKFTESKAVHFNDENTIKMIYQIASELHDVHSSGYVYTFFTHDCIFVCTKKRPDARLSNYMQIIDSMPIAFVIDCANFGTLTDKSGNKYDIDARTVTVKDVPSSFLDIQKFNIFCLGIISYIAAKSSEGRDICDESRSWYTNENFADDFLPVPTWSPKLNNFIRTLLHVDPMSRPTTGEIKAWCQENLEIRHKLFAY